jgi:hypothetical protein
MVYLVLNHGLASPTWKSHYKILENKNIEIRTERVWGGSTREGYAS